MSVISKEKLLQEVSREVQSKSGKSAENINPLLGSLSVWGEDGFSCCQSLRMGVSDDFIWFLKGKKGKGDPRS